VARPDRWMKSSGTNEFWQLYRGLPEPIRKATRRTYRVWKENPRASSPRFKKVRDVYSVRIAKTGYRAIAVEVPDGFLWIWIGPHDEYERLLSH
jgi:hypothetical protein